MVVSGIVSSEKEQILQLNECIFIKHNYNFMKLRFNDLVYLEADDNYVNAVTTDKNWLSYCLYLSSLKN